MLLVLLILVIILFSKITINKNKLKENMENKELKFIHIPKNAGTSIEELGKKLNLKWGKYDYSNLDLREKLSEIPFTLTGIIIYLKIIIILIIFV